MDVNTIESPSAVRGRGFEALALTIVVLLITAQAWGELWFRPGFEEGMRHLFSRTSPPPPTLADKFAAYWQWILAAAAVGCVATILLRSRWMRLASIIWCGSILILAIVTSVQRAPTPITAVVVLSALVTTIGVAVFRARAA